ncbi:OpgC domain-containing protein [Brucella abortus]|nr:OpgC domain-containing protein [Brucella abortus]
MLTQINIAPLIKKPVEGLFGLVTLGHQLGYNNILSMYAVMLILTPILLFPGAHQPAAYAGRIGRCLVPVRPLPRRAGQLPDRRRLVHQSPLSAAVPASPSAAGVMHVRGGGQFCRSIRC